MNSQWLILIISLPGRSATPRMRLWRALKGSGAGIMRDGVYVLPHTPAHLTLLVQQAETVRALHGTAYLIEHGAGPAGSDIQALFDRSADYAAWQDDAAGLLERLPRLTEARARRDQAQLRRELESVIAIDFFAGDARTHAEATLQDLEHALNRRFSPHEPSPSPAVIEPRAIAEFSARRWATRADLWVDRVASAWLIKRFVDPRATFLWLPSIDACPADAVGFDFDGADFTHVDRFVTFEVLVRSFALDADVSLQRIGDLVHYLDVGGAPVAEAPGLVTLLSGARECSSGDDDFLAQASRLFDTLYTAFAQEGEPA